MKKNYINKRLLKYSLYSINTKKLNNKAYIKKYYHILLANYLWNETKSLEITTKVLLKYSKNRIFNTIKNSLVFLIPIYECEYKLNIDTSERYRILKFEKEPRLCLYCSYRVLTDNIYCSVSCLNKHKATDKQYLENLSNGVSNYYKNASPEDLKIKNAKIKKTVLNFNKTLTQEERTEKYSNKKLRYTSYDNIKEKFNGLTFLFDKEFYYSNSNRYLPVKCNVCDFTWNMTNSTSLSRTICIKCHPYKKAKTQTAIFEYINSLIHCKINDKSFLDNRKEIDILCDEYKFGIEFDGLLYHSYGISKYPLYNRETPDKYYHINKTIEVERKGYQLFHIFENEWNNKPDVWKSIINKKIGLNENIDNEKTIIKNIDNNTIEEFVFHNSLDDYVDADFNIGLYVQSELYAVMSFIKIKENSYRIVNICVKNFYDTNYKNMIDYFSEIYNPLSLEYVSNRRYTQILDDFIFIKNTDVECYKFKINENKLEKCDFSEELMKLGYRIIFDCGYSVFKKHLI